MNIGDHVIIPKYKNIFAKGYTSTWSKQVFVIRENENTVPCPYVICNFNGEEIIGAFFQNNCERQVKQSLELRKDDKDEILSGKVMVIL